ncbi:MAG: hypothetical protein VKJ64_14175 [Leptolyngbyaceae bacterium]|nr:hypothetical protein [Leptolyngbyaceae bacterium]
MVSGVAIAVAVVGDMAGSSVGESYGPAFYYDRYQIMMDSDRPLSPEN